MTVLDEFTNDEYKDQDWYQDMIDFHIEVMNDDIQPFPQIPSDTVKTLRKSLIIEEVAETLKAMDEDDMVEVADGIVDSIVVLIGTAVAYGIDIRPLWIEVFKNNMSKKDGPMRENGGSCYGLDDNSFG